MARKNATAEAIDLLRSEARTNIELLRSEARTNIELLRSEVRTNGEVIARNTVLMEDMRSQFKVVVEMVLSTRADLITHFDMRFTKIEERLDALEFAVRKNSEDIRKNSDDIRKNSEDIRKNSDDIRKNSEDIRKNSEDIGKNSEDIEAMRVEIRQLRADFDRREERARIDALEKRVDKLESIAREDA